MSGYLLKQLASKKTTTENIHYDFCCTMAKMSYFVNCGRGLRLISRKRSSQMRIDTLKKNVVLPPISQSVKN